MATAEYRRGHGTLIFQFDKALVAHAYLEISYQNSVAIFTDSS